jgi:hypothetical protein
MRVLPLTLLVVLLGVLSWVLWPSSESEGIEEPVAQTEVTAQPRTALTSDPQEGEKPTQEASAVPAESENPASEEREQLNEELEVHGKVASRLSESLFARLVYVAKGEMAGSDWFHHPGLVWTKPKPVKSDGSYAFRGPYAREFADFDWRVEIGIAVRDGDEFRGSTPLLTVGTSEPFSIERSVPVELAAIEALEPIELSVPLHDWHLIPCEDLMMSGEFETRPAMWHGKPTAWFKSSDGARITKSIRLSPWHRDRKFRVQARGDHPGLDDPAFGEWIILQPGRHELATLQPIAGGMLEIFFPNSRELFPVKKGGAGFSDLTEIRLGRFDAKRRSSFEARFMVDPGASKEIYDPSWGVAPEPGGAWQGDTYVARVGWIEAGAWQLAVEARHLGRIAEPISLEVTPFDVTRITMQWLEPGKKIRIVPTPAGMGFDDYVLSTWATIATGKAHVYRFALDVQAPRELQVPPGSRSVASVSHWHGEPKVAGGPSSQLSYFRGEMTALSAPSEDQADALPELAIHRAATSLVLEIPLDTSIKGYHLGEIRGLTGQLDGHAITFTVHAGRAIGLAGFPPGHYDVRLAPYEPSITATEFLPWRTIQILAPTETDKPPDSQGSTESGK